MKRIFMAYRKGGNSARPTRLCPCPSLMKKHFVFHQYLWFLLIDKTWVYSGFQCSLTAQIRIFRILKSNPSEDAHSVTKRKISNQRFIKPTIPDLNCPRNLLSTVARLRTDHFKGIKISPDNFRSYPISRNCPPTQLTPDHIFDCKAILASRFKPDASLQEILYSPQAPDLLSLVIGALGSIWKCTKSIDKTRRM
ncbi:hypothetical protein TNCT_488481 [Trichonephila clavata]|uniref:Uncharacterized protein n=1 Tax=Trichonephila clavata TaxID=2740835 RepID=A0A8X6FYU9_TRICU|nr:hypothetical protein TNCT_488481 [Trichonephila clavata]